MQYSETIWTIIDEKSPAFFELRDRVWETPEINYEEFRSSAEHLRLLEAEGFKIERNLAGVPTAVMGEAGEDGPSSPFSGNTTRCPASASKPALPNSGRGCRRARARLRPQPPGRRFDARRQRPEGRVRCYGCPAEEGGSSKGFMVRAGVFDDVDIAISWQLAAQGKLSAAHKGMAHAAKIMAGTAIDLIRNPALAEATKADPEGRLDGNPFGNPIPDDVMLPIQLAPATLDAAE